MCPLHLYGTDTLCAKVFFSACISEVCTLLGDSAGYVDGDGRIQNRQGGIKFNRPSSLVLSRDKNSIFLLDAGNHAIQNVSVDLLQVTSIAGGSQGVNDGVGTLAKFAELSNMIVHPDGVRLFVTDAGNNFIRYINVTSGYAETLKGSDIFEGSTGESIWNSPRGIAVSTGGDELFVADSGNHRIRKIVLPAGNVTTIAGNGVGGLAHGFGTQAEIKTPWGLTVSPDGRHVYFSMQGGFRLRRLSLETSEVYTLAGRSEGSYSGIGMHAQFGYAFMDQAAWGTYIFMYVGIHIHTHTHICVCIYTYVYICVCIYMYVCI